MLGRGRIYIAGALVPGNHMSFKDNVPPRGMMERFPQLHLFNYKSKHLPTAALPASRNSAIAFSGADSIARNNENLPLCLPDPTLPSPMQLLLSIAMHSLIECSQDNKNSHMALAADPKLERAFFAISFV